MSPSPRIDRARGALTVRATRALIRSRSLALLLLASGLFAQETTITGLSVSEATVGTELTVTGTGFGTKPPAVYLAQNGVKVKGTTLKAGTPEGGTSVTVMVKKALPGVFTLVLDPKGKDTPAADSPEPLTIVLPAVLGVDGDDTAEPGDEVTITVEDAGSGKPKVLVAGVKAKVTSVTPVAVEGDGEVSSVSFLVPKKAPNGTWDVEFTNTVGGDLLPGALTITNGNEKLGKVGLLAVLPAQPSLNTSKLAIQGSFDGPTRIMATGKGKAPREVELVLPFVFGTDQAPATYSEDPAFLRVVDSAGVEWASTEGSVLLAVGAARDDLVAGSYSGQLFPVGEGGGTLSVYGRFTYDGLFELPDGGGNTSTTLDKGEAAPGVNVQVLALSGNKGPSGNFAPGNTLEITFRLAKDDGTSWHLDEMASARAAVSGPTFNYQRVLAQVSDLRTTSTDNGDGTYTYRWPVPIPSNYLPPLNDTASFDADDGELAGMPLLDGTYTLALWFYWQYTTGGDESYRDVGVTTVDFLLGGSVATIEPREVVTTTHCNQCHSELQAHGGARRDVTSCLICHTAGAEDRNVASAAGGTPDTTISFKVMIHKIHNGSHLPSVNGVTTDASGMKDYTATPRPYQLVGYGDSVHDFSEVEFPAWPNFVSPMPRDLGYSGLGAFQAQENAILNGITSCDICHGDPDGDEGPIEAPSQGDLAFTQSSRAACASCHDDWIPTQPYVANTNGMPAQLTDAACVQCHPQTGSALAVQDAHLHPLRDPSVVDGVVFDILAVGEPAAEGDGVIMPGDKLAVMFTITDSDGVALDPAVLSGRSVVVNGPTSNRNIVLPEQTLPAEMLTGPQPYTVNLPMRVYYEHVGDATAGADSFPTALTPHWNVTGQLTEVRQQTGLGAGASTLAVAASAPANYLDVADATGFARDDYVLVAGGTADAEYLRLQWVDGNRLWFSSPYAQAYAPSTTSDHAAGTTVQEVVLATLVQGAGSNYTVDAADGTIDEAALPFGDGNPIVVTYTTDFRLPETYPVALNAGPDLTERDGGWAGKSLVAGTYSVVMWGSRAVTYSLHGENNSYRDGSVAVRKDFLVGGASSLEPYELVSSVTNCNACHVDIQFHGSNRRGFESCFSCHSTSAAGDRPKYVAANAPATDGLTVSFREMVHKIHAGESLDKADEYQVIGFGQGYPDNYSTHGYDHVAFPAMPSGVQDCVRCHGVGNTAWTEPSTRQHPTEQVLAGQNWRVACSSCHDSDSERAHIESQTSPTSGAESCLICHGAGQDWDVVGMHEVR